MTTVATDQEVSPLTVCRDKSHSIWLHYPHVELLVLFFAFEGAVSSQVSVIKVASNCDEFLYPALLTLVSSTRQLKASGFLEHVDVCR